VVYTPTVVRTRPVAILLPPSEGKAAGGTGQGWQSASGYFAATTLAAARLVVAEALAKADGGDQKLLGVGGAHLLRAQEANRALIGAATLPASARYTGVVHDHFDLASLPSAARRRAATSTFVLSGLLGVVAIDDPIPDYRLKMGARLGDLGVLSRWWRPRLSPVLDEAIHGRVVVDLLTNEHRSAWEPSPGGYAGFVRASFVERSGTRAGTAVGHDAKAAKGLLARHLISAGGDPRDAMASFSHPRFDLRVEELG
jgi:uncharacterized protein